MDWEWVKQHWWAAVLYVGGIIGSVIGENILSNAIQDQTINDIAVAVLVISALLSPIIYLIVREFRQPQMTTSDISQRFEAIAKAAAGEKQRDQLIEQPPVTGDTPVNQVANRINRNTSATTIDYHPPARPEIPSSILDYIHPSEDMKEFLSLKLGEMALLRRLGVALGERQPSRRCVAVLQASGIAAVDSSIARLEDLKLIQEGEHDTLRLTDKGWRFIYLSNQALVHDDGLVVAYRRVTPIINKTVRFDGK
jgi:hypothetical protein